MRDNALHQQALKHRFELAERRVSRAKVRDAILLVLAIVGILFGVFG